MPFPPLWRIPHVILYPKAARRFTQRALTSINIAHNCTSISKPSLLQEGGLPDVELP